jgi:hypothetical protein
LEFLQIFHGFAYFVPLFIRISSTIGKVWIPRLASTREY